MSDEQLHARAINRRIIVVAVLLMLVSIGLLYFYFSTDADIQSYNSAKAQETSLRNQVTTLEQANAQMMSTIEQTGLELVSFTEDKIRYINLASALALRYNVDIGKLTVSDVWQEGTMAGMTTTIEICGSLENIKNFVNAYCDSGSTNRVNVISLRSTDRYVWVERDIDNNQILQWIDLSLEESYYEKYMKDLENERQQAATEAGIAVAPTESPEVKDELPITLATLFSDSQFKIYLEIDFLGRQ